MSKSSSTGAQASVGSGLGQRLTTLRLALGLSGRALADLADIQQQRLWTWENGRDPWASDLAAAIRRIAAALDVPGPEDECGRICGWLMSHSKTPLWPAGVPSWRPGKEPARSVARDAAAVAVLTSGPDERFPERLAWLRRRIGQDGPRTTPAAFDRQFGLEDGTIESWESGTAWPDEARLATLLGATQVADQRAAARWTLRGEGDPDAFMHPHKLDPNDPPPRDRAKVLDLGPVLDAVGLLRKNPKIAAEPLVQGALAILTAVSETGTWKLTPSPQTLSPSSEPSSTPSTRRRRSSLASGGRRRGSLQASAA